MSAGQVIALFGPTAVGKTAVAIELGERLRQGGENPVAISCDAIQIYRGLEVVSGAPAAAERERLEHRLVAFADPREEFSAGRFAALARAEIDRALAAGRRPILVGGTGLYLRATLADLALRPSVPESVRAAVEAEIEAHGSARAHAALPADVASKVHPNDRKRIARALELQRVGEDPPERSEGLWTARLLYPTLLVGLIADRELLDRRIAARVEAMVAAGARAEAERAEREGFSRTARAALGLAQLRAGDIEGMKTAHRRYARRQLTWMRRMEGVEALDVGALDPGDVADRVVELLGPR